MTPLQAFDELVVERRDLPEYEVARRCANPFCPNQADDKHEVYPRSQAAGVVWWVELPGRYLIGNRIGLCRGCHERTDAHTVQIIWDDQTSQLAWVDFQTRDAGFLDPMPPIHKIPGLVAAAFEADQAVYGVSFEKAGERIDPTTVGVPDVDEVIREGLEDPVEQVEGHPFVPTEEPATDEDFADIASTAAGGAEGSAGQSAGQPGGPNPGPAIGDTGQEVGLTAAVEEPSEAPAVPVEGHVSDEELLARRVRATAELVKTIEETIPSFDDEPLQAEPAALEPAAQEPQTDDEIVDQAAREVHYDPPAIVPVVVEDLPEPPAAEPVGSDQAAIAAAQAATEEANRKATATVDVTGLGEFVPEQGTRYHADLLIDPESLEIEILAGDMRAKILLEEQIEKAKRAPKPRAPRPPQDPDRPREAPKNRRTWSIAVPKDERDEEKVAAGEDGYMLIEDGLELARDKMGRNDDPGWKYLTLIDVINWFNLNYTPDGED